MNHYYSNFYKVIAVTGANGFLGSALCNSLEKRGFDVKKIQRNRNKHDNYKSALLDVDMDVYSDLTKSLIGVDCVIHCAARAHILSERSDNPKQDFHNANVELTKSVALQAAKLGVKRFIYISSVGVLGSTTNGRQPFLESDIPSPEDDYSASKLDGERGLKKIAEESGLEVVVIRPPLIYGSGATGNVLLLKKLISMRIPLPLLGIHNLRSFVSIENLIELLILCINHPSAPGKTFLISDGRDISTAAFAKKIACELKRKIILFYMPVFLLRLLASLLGKEKTVKKITDSLQVDFSYTARTLGWSPSDR